MKFHVGLFRGSSEVTNLSARKHLFMEGSSHKAKTPQRFSSVVFTRWLFLTFWKIFWELSLPFFYYLQASTLLKSWFNVFLISFSQVGYENYIPKSTESRRYPLDIIVLIVILPFSWQGNSSDIHKFHNQEVPRS